MYSTTKFDFCILVRTQNNDSFSKICSVQCALLATRTTNETCREQRGLCRDIRHTICSGGVLARRTWAATSGAAPPIDYRRRRAWAVGGGASGYDIVPCTQRLQHAGAIFGCGLIPQQFTASGHVQSTPHERARRRRRFTCTVYSGRSSGPEARTV